MKRYELLCVLFLLNMLSSGDVQVEAQLMWWMRWANWNNYFSCRKLLGFLHSILLLPATLFYLNFRRDTLLLLKRVHPITTLPLPFLEDDLTFCSPLRDMSTYETHVGITRSTKFNNLTTLVTCQISIEHPSHCFRPSSYFQSVSHLAAVLHCQMKLLNLFQKMSPRMHYKTV